MGRVVILSHLGLELTSYMTVGDPVKLIAIQSWQAAAPDSIRPTIEVGLIKRQSTPLPKAGVTLVNPENSPSEHTELI